MIVTEFRIRVEEKDEDDNAPVVKIEARTETDKPPSFKAGMVATEHMMTATALNSNAGFEKALELLVKGAKTNRGFFCDPAKLV